MRDLFFPAQSLISFLIKQRKRRTLIHICGNVRYKINPGGLRATSSAQILSPASKNVNCLNLLVLGVTFVKKVLLWKRFKASSFTKKYSSCPERVDVLIKCHIILKKVKEIFLTYVFRSCISFAWNVNEPFFTWGLRCSEFNNLLEGLGFFRGVQPTFPRFHH